MSTEYKIENQKCGGGTMSHFLRKNKINGNWTQVIKIQCTNNDHG